MFIYNTRYNISQSQNYFKYMNSDSEQQEIQDMRKINDGQEEYLIKWKGWKQTTWQPAQNLAQIPDMIYDFKAGLNGTNKKKKSHPRIKKSVQKPDNEDQDQIFKKTIKSKKNRKKMVRISQKYNDDSVNQKQQASQTAMKDRYSIDQEQVNQYNSMNSNFISSNSSGPRIKFTSPHLEQVKGNSCETQRQRGCVYRDLVKRILQIQRINGRWMVEIQFLSDRYQRAWQERDLIRLLYPLQLLNFYQNLAGERKIMI